LLVEPALPSFANISDRLLARAVVQNQTTNAGEVLITLELDDKAKIASPSLAELAGHGTAASASESQGLVGPATRRVSIGANGSAAVEFPVEFTAAGVAQWVWKARFVGATSGGFTDAVQSSMDIGYVAPLLREILFVRVTASETNLLARANPELLAGQGTITVSLANMLLNELGETLGQLLQYPYGCAEQSASSLLPWLVLHNSPGIMPLPHRGTNDWDRKRRDPPARVSQCLCLPGAPGRISSVSLAAGIPGTPADSGSRPRRSLSHC
jgi:uncharacterized protein YfaS (alpha-2-macroglobulin family)